MSEKPEPERYVVKISRAFRSSILFMGTQAEAKEYASKLNTEYQTDEYRVEKYDRNRWYN